MTRWALALVALLATGCGGKGEDEDDDTGAGDDGDDGGDDTGGDGEIVYPSGDRILLYYGHGGWEPDSFSKGVFENVDTRWKDAFGWNTDHRNTWSADLDAFRMIGLMAPTDPFSAAEVADLQVALDRGSRVVLFGDRASCGSADIAQLLADLGVGMGFTGESADQNQIIQASDYSSSHPVTAPLSDSIRFKEPCHVDPSGGAAIVRDSNRNVMIAAQRPGNGGDVMVIGDFQFMDDGGYLDHEDNGLLADGLVLVAP